MTESAEVDNRYRRSLGWALPGARTQAERVAEAFAITRRALAAGAWDSSVADAFSGACTSVGSSAAAAAQDCVAILQRRHAREPVSVPPFDRRARWS
jgi:hypothetical protein